MACNNVPLVLLLLFISHDILSDGWHFLNSYKHAVVFSYARKHHDNSNESIIQHSMSIHINDSHDNTPHNFWYLSIWYKFRYSQLSVHHCTPSTNPSGNVILILYSGLWSYFRPLWLWHLLSFPLTWSPYDVRDLVTTMCLACIYHPLVHKYLCSD